MAADAMQIDAATLAEAIETLERVGCQWDFCDGPTPEPVDMVTCFACETLAKLRVAAGRPPRTDDERTWQERHDEWERNYMARATGGGRPADSDEEKDHEAQQATA